MPAGDVPHAVQIGGQRIKLQKIAKQLPVGDPLRRGGIQDLLQQGIDFIHQLEQIEVRAVPLQQGEFRIVAPTGLAAAKRLAQLIDGTRARG